MAPAVTPVRFRFGPCELQADERRLLVGSEVAPLGRHAFDLLVAMVEGAGHLLTKDELLRRVWGKVVVEENTLQAHVSALRKVLGPDAIATISGKGYRFTLDVTPIPSSGPSSSPQRSHNLPASTTRIVGREDAIAAIRQDLQDSRLVSIVGPGGVGKTTVGLAVAEQVLGSLRHGVWLIDLSPLKDPALVPSAIATAIGLAAHSANMLAALCEFLRDREMLLLLDSCEHIVDAVASCASRILADAAGLRILATSREPLRLKGERVRRLPGLDTPPATVRLTALEAESFPAIQLFIDRATERVESFRLDDANAPVVAEICRRLDGLALAIELAATRIDAFGVNELLQQFDDRFGLLTGHRASAERHRTLTATIDWSYALLSERESALMRRLSTFAGTFNLASACAVGGDEGTARATLVDDLASLVAKSLLATEARGIEVEYRFLDTTRSYAQEKLSALDETAAARRRHAEHHLQLAERAKAEAASLTKDEWLRRYGSRIDDLRDALRWALASMDTATLGVELTVATIPFWEALSLLEECRVAVERALEARFEAHRGQGEAQTLYLALSTSLLYTRGPTPEVKAALTKALELAEQRGDTESQLECLRGLSEHDMWTGNTRSALSASDRIRSMGLATGHAKSSENADAQAGSALRYLGDLAAAQNHLEKIVDRPMHDGRRTELSRYEFDQWLSALGSLASVLWLRGFPDQALALAARQRDEAEASHHAVPLCAAILHTTAGIALFVGDLEGAGRLLRFVENHATEHRLTFWKLVTSCLRGRWLLDCGEPFPLEEIRHAIEELYKAGLRMRYPSMLANFSEGLAQHGHFDAARASIDKALDESQSSGQLWGMPEILRMKGNLVRREGKPGSSEIAIACYTESLRWAREQGALSWELRTAVSLVELWRESGGNVQAEQMLSSAYERFDEGFETRDLRRARVLLGLP